MSDVQVKFRNYTQPVYYINTGQDNLQSADSHQNSNGSTIIGTTSMIPIFRQINRISDFPFPVLIRGETGTGKELIAKALHYNSGNRKSAKFLAVNCAGIPEGLLESILFGHVRGSFTGALVDKKGFMEEADKGTLFLDEISEMPVSLQSKLLRVLQEKEIYRVGSTEVKKVDVRIIAASNRDLEESIEQKTFREDLFYRLNAFPIFLPNLNERREDIPFIVEHFIGKYNNLYKTEGIEITGIQKDALEIISTYNSWKGNIRQLENIITRAMILRGTGAIGPEDLVFEDRKLKDAELKSFLSKKRDDSVQSIVLPSALEIKSNTSENPNNAAPPRSLITSNEPLWYERGVFPIMLSTLANDVYGTKSMPTLKKIIGERKVYSIQFGSRETYAVIVSEATLPFLFNQVSTGYNKILESIKNDEFNRVVLEPFMLTTVTDLVENPNCYKSNINIYQGLDDAKEGYILKDSTKPKVFAVTEKNAKHFVSPHGKSTDSALRLPNLIEDIKKSYELFRNWRPPK